MLFVCLFTARDGSQACEKDGESSKRTDRLSDDPSPVREPLHGVKLTCHGTKCLFFNESGAGCHCPYRAAD